MALGTRCCRVLSSWLIPSLCLWLLVVLSVLRVDESRQPGARRPDLFGFVTFSGALGALVYALIEVGTKGWGNSVILACFAATVILLIAFLVGGATPGQFSVRRTDKFDISDGSAMPLA